MKRNKQSQTGMMGEVSPKSPETPHPASLAALKARIRRLEGGEPCWAQAAPSGARPDDSGGHHPANHTGQVTLAPDIDTTLPWGGLPGGALHEILPAGPGHPGAATAFSAILAARFARHGERNSHQDRGKDGGEGRIVLWCGEADVMDAGRLYAPGLRRFGLEAPQLVLARARRADDVLWMLEEALQSGAPGTVVAEIGEISLTASRRLQLAAEKTGVAALLLHPYTPRPAPSAALTRWRIGPAPSLATEAKTMPPSAAPPAPRLRAELFRCRGGAPGAWLMEWQDETGALDLVAPLRDRTDHTPPTRLAG